MQRPRRSDAYGSRPAAAAAFATFSSDTDDTAWISDDSDVVHTPQFVAAHCAHASDDDDFEVPRPAVHRDSHASLVWVPRGADALNQWTLERADRKPDFAALTTSSNTAAKHQLPTLDLTPATTSLSSAPAVASDAPPPKDTSVFAAADVSFPIKRGLSPGGVIAALMHALRTIDTVDVRDDRHAWRLDVACLCVAEHIAFTVQLAQLDEYDCDRSCDRSLDVAFHRFAGDETRYLALVTYVRAQCRAIDADALPLVLAEDDATLAPWMDARLPLTDATTPALEPRDALELLALLRADLHVSTRFEAAKQLKDACRHAGSRATLRRVDPAGLAAVFTALLGSDALALTRFGVFALLQFARDPAPVQRGTRFFGSQYAQRAAAMQLADVLRVHRNAACGGSTCAMVCEVQRSWLFA